MKVILMVRNIMILGFLLIAGCRFYVGEDDKISSGCKAMTSEKFSINGYYYEGKLAEGEIIDVFFFYENGVVMNFGALKIEDIQTYEMAFGDEKLALIRQQKKTFWGVYRVDDDSISFENLYPSSGPWISFTRIGNISDDSTFVVSKVEQTSDKSSEQVNEVYHFKKFSPKPDSVNVFVCCSDNRSISP